MTEKKLSLILASRSPRRKELLSWSGLPFSILTLNIPEVSSFKHPQEVVMDLAKQKASAVWNHLKEERKNDWGKSFFPAIIGSDTIVSIDEEILGIPKDAKHAREMLNKLSDKTHQVFTGVYIGILSPEKEQMIESTFYCQTDVTFARIDDDMLDLYIKSGDPLDKAGAYGIQGQALSFISEIKGSYSNVVGFPLHEFINALKMLLGHSDDYSGKWRQAF